MRCRWMDNATARRTRASSTGARVVLKQSDVPNNTGYDTIRSVASRAATSDIVGELPATSSSPLASPANYVVASSTTATTNPASAGGPPSDAGNLSLRAKVQRAPRCRDTKRNGPLPRGASLNAAMRIEDRGTDASRCAGTIGSSASSGGSPGGAVRNGGARVGSSAATPGAGPAGAAPRG